MLRVHAQPFWPIAFGHTRQRGYAIDAGLCSMVSRFTPQSYEVFFTVQEHEAILTEIYTNVEPIGYKTGRQSNNLSVTHYEPTNKSQD